MIPKKSSEIVKLTADKLELSETKVENIVNFFYKELRKTLSSLSDLKIDNPGIGHFLIREKKVDKKIAEVTSKLETITEKTFRSHYQTKHLEEKLEQLNSIKKKIVIFLEKRKQFRDEQAKYHLEKQKTNTGGN